MSLRNNRKKDMLFTQAELQKNEEPHKISLSRTPESTTVDVG